MFSTGRGRLRGSFRLPVRDKLIKPIAEVSVHNSTTNDFTSTAIPLPRINLPKFSGLYTEWISFRDLFLSLVVNNENLSNVQRLHYLKASLTGEAAIVIKNISVTDANYATAWSELQTRYENLRVIVTSHLHAIFDLTPMKSECASELKRVSDVINDSVHALHNLGRNPDDDFVVAITVRKLDQRSLREWAISQGDIRDPPRYEDLRKFLLSKLRALEAISETRDSSLCKTNKTGTTKALVSSVSQYKCPSCREAHALCTNFKTLSSGKRKLLVEQQRCCHNCLHKGHFLRNCPSTKRCNRCQAKHHSLLHDEGETATNAESIEKQDSSLSTTSKTKSTIESKSALTLQVSVNETNIINSPILSSTAQVVVSSMEGRSLPLRALINTGADRTFLSERAAQALKLKRKKVHVRVTGLGERFNCHVKHSARIQLISPLDYARKVEADALIIPSIAARNTTLKSKLSELPQFQKLKLADPDPVNNSRIDLLIGLDIFGSILTEGLHKGSSREPSALNTIFGWILFGPCALTAKPESPCRVRTVTVDTGDTPSSSTDDLLRSFWELNEIPSTTPPTEEERICEEWFVATHSRRRDGRYIVRLPFKPGGLDMLGDSFSAASKSFASLERQLAKDDKLSAAYRFFLEEYAELGHMAPLQSCDFQKSSVYYLPHHPVIRESSKTSPLRVVFNASSVTNSGYSLNDCLLTGRKLQADLTSLLLRWRNHRLVFVADMAKMFRQILVHEEDADLQRIIWRSDPDQLLSHSNFKLTTVTYGTSAAPFLAM